MATQSNSFSTCPCHMESKPITSKSVNKGDSDWWQPPPTIHTWTDIYLWCTSVTVLQKTVCQSNHYNTIRKLRNDELAPYSLTVHKWCCKPTEFIFFTAVCRDLCLTAVCCSSVKSRLIDFCGAIFFTKDTLCSRGERFLFLLLASDRSPLNPMSTADSALSELSQWKIAL